MIRSNACAVLGACSVANTIACGMLPRFRLEQVQIISNRSLAGAYLALLDGGVLDELSRLARQLNVVELNLDPDFETRYMDQLSHPIYMIDFSQIRKYMIVL